MKAISLTQPWASLVATGAKQIETRSWRTQHRGEVAIHAAKGFPGHAKRLCESRLVCRVLGWPECPKPLTQEWLTENGRLIKSLPLGCVIATARLTDCIPTDLIRALVPGFSDQEEAFGNYEPGRWAWIMDDVKALPRPISAKGALSLWDWTPEVVNG